MTATLMEVSWFSWRFSAEILLRFNHKPLGGGEPLTRNREQQPPRAISAGRISDPNPIYWETVLNFLSKAICPA